MRGEIETVEQLCDHLLSMLENHLEFQVAVSVSATVALLSERDDDLALRVLDHFRPEGVNSAFESEVA